GTLESGGLGDFKITTGRHTIQEALDDLKQLFDKKGGGFDTYTKEVYSNGSIKMTRKVKEYIEGMFVVPNDVGSHGFDVRETYWIEITVLDYRKYQSTDSLEEYLNLR
ncbi:hypothetical protein, partial [Bacillus mycoides]|uniref:hypothetical protein n=1 Tax=Bacillus mycoides TaxID=1405 RepID=UPI003A810702